MNVIVWFLLTLSENSFYQSPTQIQTEDCSLKEQSKFFQIVLDGSAMVPAVTDLPEG